MSAPTAGLSALRDLSKNWDSYGGEPIAEAALGSARTRPPRRCADGGVQVELHGGGVEFEIEIAPDGRVTSVCLELVRR